MELNNKNQYEAYLFVYFTGEYKENGEQIYFATSKDGLYWDELNNNNPVIISEVGEKGVRDPYVFRTVDGKFIIVSTDLKINGNGNWWRAQSAGSQSIVVVESTDLVNWSTPRLAKIALDDAGCTWASEVVYDVNNEEYMAFWASRVASDNYAKQRIYMAKTKDFVTFSEPEVYIERPKDVIDATITFHDGMYYRFYKDEVDKNILIDTCDQLISKEFKNIPSESVTSIKGVEGPEIFKLNGENKWVLLLDEYGKNGYFPLVTDDLTTCQFRRLSSNEYKMPKGARHGSVIPITLAEYERLIQKYNK